MLKVGIVGLPNVGKSTLFNTITKKQVEIQNYPFTTIDPNIGVVKVPDPRLEILAKLSNSKKIIPAIIEFIDIAGLVKGASSGEGLGNQFLSHIREADAIAQVVRVFQNPNIIHVSGTPDPVRDIETINLELIMADLQTMDKIIDKAQSEAKTGGEKPKKRLKILEQLKNFLLSGKLANELSLPKEEKELIKDINLLTQKPLIYALNVSEKTGKADIESIKKDIIAKTGASLEQIIEIPIKIENELAELETDEQESYKKELGITSQISGLDALITKSYQILNLITFLTTGEDETRAWTITAGSKAPAAGGKIHSDFEEKFIRAEVIPCSEFVKIGSWAKARESGALKTVGRDYIVQDGDIVEFKI